MKKIFISGSMNIKNINPKVVKRIDNIIKSEFSVIVGDASGSDSSVQHILKNNKYQNVTVYCSGNYPRNNIGNWQIKPIETKHQANTRAFFTAKDLEMAKDCDYGLMIWDSKSTGTLGNVLELLSQKKTSIVFVNKFKEFLQVDDVSSFEKLVSMMSDVARLKAETKIHFSTRINKLKHRQLNLFEDSKTSPKGRRAEQ